MRSLFDRDGFLDEIVKAHAMNQESFGESCSNASFNPLFLTIEDAKRRVAS